MSRFARGGGIRAEGRQGSLRPSLPFKSRLEAASPRAPRAPPRLWSVSHVRRLPARPVRLFRRAGPPRRRTRRGEAREPGPGGGRAAPRPPVCRWPHGRRASLLWEWMSLEADTPLMTVWAAGAFQRVVGEGACPHQAPGFPVSAGPTVCLPGPPGSRATSASPPAGAAVPPPPGPPAGARCWSPPGAAPPLGSCSRY